MSGRESGKNDAGWLVSGNDPPIHSGVDLIRNGPDRSIAVGAQDFAAVTRTQVLVFDKNPDRLWVLTTAGRVILESHSEAQAMALVAQGVLLGDRRDLGLVQFPGTEIPNPVQPPQSPRGDGQLPGGHRDPDLG